ncbi:hypothetical protein SUGI_0341830 [Cryptomeria japonica]|nr:hypothetical protein SUGI_0341830 [Cryptomeria japonica]
MEVPPMKVETTAEGMADPKDERYVCHELFLLQAYYNNVGKVLDSLMMTQGSISNFQGVCFPHWTYPLRILGRE